jgi:hypothetical protein
VLVCWTLITAATFAACSDAGEKEKERQSKRLWGRDRLAQAVEARAKETIDPAALERDEKLRQRVLAMDFEEVVARLGFVEYKGIARFELTAHDKTLEVVEDTTIQHGLHGTFRVLQLDKDGDIAREVIYNNGILFVRNGGGEMRVQGIIKDQHLVVRDEAWQPLRTFTAYYGQRCGLRKTGSKTVQGRNAAVYSFQLLPGPDLISVKGMEGQKKPIALSGDLYVDEQTGAPIRANMKGVLEIPSQKGEPTGKLSLQLNYTLKTIPGDEIKPKSYIPTIKRHPVDLEPLAFLDGGTHTSTVIGGKKPKMLKPPPTPDLGTSIPEAPTSTSAQKPAEKSGDKAGDAADLGSRVGKAAPPLDPSRSGPEGKPAGKKKKP